AFWSPEVPPGPCPALGAAFYAWPGFLLVLTETKGVAGTRITRLPKRVCFRCDAFVALPCGERLRLRPKDGGINPPLHGPDSVGANRPAGTREALPGTICGTCVLRFKRKGTNYRAPTQKNGWRAIPRHA